MCRHACLRWSRGARRPPSMPRPRACCSASPATPRAAWPRACCARTCTTPSARCRCGCRRCASVARTWSCSRTCSSSGSTRAMARTSAWPPVPTMPCCGMPGPATCANCAPPCMRPTCCSARCCCTWSRRAACRRPRTARARASASASAPAWPTWNVARWTQPWPITATTRPPPPARWGSACARSTTTWPAAARNAAAPGSEGPGARRRRTPAGSRRRPDGAEAPAAQEPRMSTARTIPVWAPIGDATAAWFEAQAADAVQDVVVVGAGIAGLTTAACLLREGRQVLVVDRGGVGAGETLRTTAHLASALDDRFTLLQRHHGKDGARLAAASHAAAIDWIEDLANGAPDCGFHRVPGYLYSHAGEPEGLRREMQAARESGLEVRWCEAGEELPARFGPAIRFAGQARIDAGGYLLALAREVRDAGGRFLRAHVQRVAGGDEP